MHTNEEPNKSKPDTTKRMSAGPGEQVAVNRTMHGVIQLHESDSGEYYPVVTWDSVPKLIRGEYHPVGNMIQFPKAWGRKWAAQKLITQKIGTQKDIIASAEIELQKLEKCLREVNEWQDTDK